MKALLKYVLPPLIVLVGVGALVVMYLPRPKAETRIPEVLPPLVNFQQSLPLSRVKIQILNYTHTNCN